MEALTGRRRKLDDCDNDNANEAKPGSSQYNHKSSLKVLPGPPQGTEFIPELYKSARNKKLRIEQPETEEERLMMKTLPSDSEAALCLIRGMFRKDVFQNRLPPIILYSQLSAILSNQFLIDTQLSKLAKENKIVTFSTFTSSNYLIVFLEDFISIKRAGIFHRFVTEVLTSEDVDASSFSSNYVGETSRVVRRSLENSRYFTKESLRRKWKFEEDEIRQLVNGGFLGIQEGGIYCISLPGAGEFIKCYEKGKKAVISAIKKSKFGEVLQRELEQRPMKKAAPLGVIYHMYDLIGSREIDKVETTSGPLLRMKRKV